MSVFTVVYFSYICYESHPSCYFDCAYIGVSEGDMRDDYRISISYLYNNPIHPAFLTIWPLKNGLNKVILRFRLASSWFPEMEVFRVLTHICMYMSKFVHVMALLLPLIYNYLYSHLVREKKTKQKKLIALLLILQIRLKIFSYFFVQVFCQTGFALSVYT